MSRAASPDATARRARVAVLDGAGQVRFRLSPDGAVVRLLAGPEAEARLETLIGRHLPAEDRPALRAAVAEALREGQTLDLEHRIRRSDGSLGWMRFRAVPAQGPDGGVEEWLGTAEDVTARREADDRLREGEERLRLALDATGLGTWEWDLLTGEFLWSEAVFAFLGHAPGAVAPGREAWAARVHPEDRPGLEARFDAARDSGGPFEAEFRVLPGDGSMRWGRSTGRVLAGPGGARRMIGVLQDVTAAREAEARQRLLLAELQHRVRNGLAVLRSILRRSAQGAADLEGYVSHLEGRLGALARVQAAAIRTPGAGLDLEVLLRDEFRVAAATEEQVALAGPPLRLPTRTAELLGLAVHELATNALKHGALAKPGGRVAVDWSVEAGDPPRLRLRWGERAGRPLPAPGPPGFGTELIERMLAYNLGAEAAIRHGPGGLACEIVLPLPR